MSKASKKYELVKTKECTYTNVHGTNMYRIRALKSFGAVKKGDLGGYIEKEENLSQKGDCWVYDNAKVYNDAMIGDHAEVHGNAKVYGYAVVCDDADVCSNVEIYDGSVILNQSKVHDNAKVYGNARLQNQAYVYGRCRIYGGALVCGMVCGTAKVFHTAVIYSNAVISNDAVIRDKFDYCTVSGFGSTARSTTFFRCEDGSIKVNCGCFNGTLDEFRVKVKETHNNNQYAKEYLAIADIVETRLSK